MPHLFLPGAQKSASSTLFNLLKTHPYVYGSPRKEPHFFSRDDLFEMDIASYHSWAFDSRGGEFYYLDGSQSYLSVEDVPERIRALLGLNVRFVIVLRNPVDRAASAFRYFRAKPKGEVVRSIDNITPHDISHFDLKKLLRWEQHEVQDALAVGKINGRSYWSSNGFPFRYFHVGAYSNHISRYLNVFPREHFLFLTFEDVTRRQRASLMRAARFLDLDEALFDVPDEALHDNKTMGYKHKGLGSVIYAAKEKVRPLRHYLPDRLLQRVRSFERKNMMEHKQDHFAGAIQDELRRIFAPDIMKTEALTGLCLDGWFEGGSTPVGYGGS